MSTIDTLLARALQLRDPHIPPDIVAYDDTTYPGLPPEGLPLAEGWGRDLADETAAAHLRSLCEVAVAHALPGQIAEFITEQLPGPDWAWILGCLLQLAEAEDGAQFWWQYAAGAGVGAAAYCLYLHHRALGDRRAAAFWHDQSTIPGRNNQDSYEHTAESNVPVLLRVLEHLAPAGRPHTEATLAVMDFVAAAVATGYTHHPEVEIPLPGPYFAEQLGVILATTSPAPRTHRGRQQARTLPARRAPGPNCADQPEEEPAGQPEPKRVLVEFAAADVDAESASAFREAVAACWAGATTDRTGKDREAGQPGVRLRYWLDLHRLTEALHASRMPPRTRTRQAS
ncbi:DUF6207 family protein [Streptomyces phaeochromogenes]|uniref:DUF6207 family protein n=1 Tax=Streptomyces phaeochromogenes TaxID=1923 RepID=UPI00367B3565